MYGITSTDIATIDTKIEYQKEYIKRYVTNFAEDDKDPLASVYSANLNPKKYFAEINARVNTLVANAKDKGLMPVFLTLTAPSKYHKKDKDGNLLISPNETAKALTQIFNDFTNVSIFKKMRDELGHGLEYFRVYEPHESGVPHLHALAFIPPQFINAVKKRFYSYFMQDRWGLNIKGLGFRYTWYKEKGGAVGYVMKYILKTFKDSDNEKVEHAVYWYIKHKVRRFLTSRTLVSLSIYRKVRYYFKENWGIDSLKAITHLFRIGAINRYFDDTLITFSFTCKETYEQREIILWQKDSELVLKKNAKDEVELYNSKKQREDLRTKRSSLQKVEHKPLDYTGLNNYIPNKSNRINGCIIIPSKLKDHQLFSYYQKLNSCSIDDIDLTHLQLVKNEMINRGLIDEQVQSLNNCVCEF